MRLNFIRVAYWFDSSSRYEYPVAPHNGGPAPKARGVLLLGKWTLNLVYIDRHVANMSISQIPIKDLNRTELLYNAHFWFPNNGNKDI